MRNLTDELISSTLQAYAVRSDHDLCDKIRTYISTLLLWNRKISLTTVTEPLEILKFHFGESFFGAAVVPIREGRLADVGSGAGFPGIPLRMLIPRLDVTLIESNARKCAFLSEIVRKIELEQVSVLHLRTEDVPESTACFDFIAARAVGQHRAILAWAIAHLTQMGKVVLWLGEEDTNDILSAPGWLWSSPVLIPNSKRRYILSGSPNP